MSDAITLEVVGLDKVVARVGGAGDRIAPAVRTAVNKLGVELLTKVKGEKLTGQVLGVRTGRLRRSINLEMSGDATYSEASVGTNVAYGRFWELGFTGVEQVRAHTRRTRKGNAQVRAHTRSVNQAARPFLAPALAEMRSRVAERLQAAAVEVARGAGA